MYYNFLDAYYAVEDEEKRKQEEQARALQERSPFLPAYMQSVKDDLQQEEAAARKADPKAYPDAWGPQEYARNMLENLAPIGAGAIQGSGRIAGGVGWLAGQTDRAFGGDGQNFLKDLGYGAMNQTDRWAETINREAGGDSQNMFQQVGNAFGQSAPSILLGSAMVPGALGAAIGGAGAGAQVAPTLLQSAAGAAMRTFSDSFGEAAGTESKLLNEGYSPEEANVASQNVNLYNLALNGLLESTVGPFGNMLGSVGGKAIGALGQGFGEYLQEPGQKMGTDTAERMAAQGINPSLGNFASELVNTLKDTSFSDINEEGLVAGLSSFLTGLVLPGGGKVSGRKELAQTEAAAQRQAELDKDRANFGANETDLESALNEEVRQLLARQQVIDEQHSERGEQFRDESDSAYMQRLARQSAENDAIKQAARIEAADIAAEKALADVPAQDAIIPAEDGARPTEANAKAAAEESFLGSLARHRESIGDGTDSRIPLDRLDTPEGQQELEDLQAYGWKTKQKREAEALRQAQRKRAKLEQERNNVPDDWYDTPAPAEDNIYTESMRRQGINEETDPQSPQFKPKEEYTHTTKPSRELSKRELNAWATHELDRLTTESDNDIDEEGINQNPMTEEDARRYAKILRARNTGDIDTLRQMRGNPEATSEEVNSPLVIGRRAKGIDKRQYNKARQLMKQGVDNETMRKNTGGWYVGEEGKLKHEVIDNPQGMSVEQKEDGDYTLPQVYDNPALYKMYPHLKRMKVALRPIAETDANGNDLQGRYDPDTNTIEINSEYQGGKTTLIHEVQHAVQQYEDFNSGMSASTDAQSDEEYQNDPGERESRTVEDRFYKDQQWRDENPIQTQDEVNSPLFLGTNKNKDYSKMKLRRANQMLAQGADAKEIRSKTGFYKGVDGEWKYELADHPENIMKVPEIAQRAKLQGGSVPLDEVYYNKALFKAYPELRDYKVIVDDTMPNGTAGRQKGDEKTIWLNPKMLDVPFKNNVKPGWGSIDNETPGNSLNGYETLIHEVQHAIQHIEGFAPGGNVALMGQISSEYIDTPQSLQAQEELDDFMKGLSNQDRPNLINAVMNVAVAQQHKANYDHAVKSGAPQDEIDRIGDLVVSATKKATDAVNKVSVDLFKKFYSLDNVIQQKNADYAAMPEYDRYFMLAGEIESRDAATRSNYTPEQLRDIMPLTPSNAIMPKRTQDGSFLWDNQPASNEVATPERLEKAPADVKAKGVFMDVYKQLTSKEIVDEQQAQDTARLYSNFIGNFAKRQGTSASKLWRSMNFKIKLTDRLSEELLAAIGEENKAGVTLGKRLDNGALKSMSITVYNSEAYDDIRSLVLHHETGHFLMELYRATAKLSPDNVGAQADWNTIKEFFGEEYDAKTEKITDIGMERFANAYVGYLYGAKLDTKTEKMKPIFQRMTEWLMDWWTNVNPKYLSSNSSKLRDMFDNMVANDETFDSMYSVDAIREAVKPAVAEEKLPPLPADPTKGRKATQKKEDVTTPTAEEAKAEGLPSATVTPESPSIAPDLDGVIDQFINEPDPAIGPDAAEPEVTTESTDSKGNKLQVTVKGNVTTKTRIRDTSNGFNLLRNINSPSIAAKVYTKFATVFEQGNSAQREQDRLKKHYQHNIDKILGKPGIFGRKGGYVTSEEDRKSMYELLIDGDYQQHDFTDAELKEMGVKENVARGYRAARQVWKSIARRVNAQRTKYNKEEMNVLEGYVPHFFHAWRVYDPDGNIIGNFKSFSKASNFAKEKAKDDFKLTVAPATQDFGGMAKTDAQIMGDMQYFKFVRNVADVFALNSKDAAEFASKSARMASKSRVYNNAKHRLGVKGWDTDMEYALRHSANLASRYIAMDTFKHEARKYFERNYGRFDKKWTGVAKYTHDYINDVLGVPSDWENAQNFLMDKLGISKLISDPDSRDRPATIAFSGMRTSASVAKLGLFNIASMVMNYTSIFNVSALVGYRHTAKAIRMYLSPNRETNFLKQKLYNATQIDTDVTMENASTYSGLSKSRSAWMQLNMGPFRFFDNSARKMAVLAGYNEAIAKGMKGKQAYAHAREVADKTNFNYGVEDTPNFIRRAGPAGEVLTQFKKYGIKQAEFISPRYGHLNAAGQARYWAQAILLSGLTGAVPGYQAIRWFIKTFFDEKDIDMMFKEELMELPVPNSVKRTLAYGFASNFGLNISQRTGQGDLIPTSISDATGPFLGMAYDIGVGAAPAVKGLFKGDVGPTLDLLQQVIPGVANPAKAIAGEIIDPRRTRTKFKYDGLGERLIRGVGIQPIREAIAGDTIALDNYNQSEKSKAESEAIDEYVRNYRRTGSPELRAAQEKLRELGVDRNRVIKAVQEYKSGDTQLDRARGTAYRGRDRERLNRLDSYSDIAN